MRKEAAVMNSSTELSLQDPSWYQAPGKHFSPSLALYGAKDTP